MLADLSGMTLEIPNIEETGSLGAAAIAMVGAGEYASLYDALAAFDTGSRQHQPNAQHFMAYQKKYRRYLKLVALFKEFEESAHD